MNFFNKLLLNSNNIKSLSYSAMWSNCGRKSSKSLKRLYQRPDFLPLSSEISSQNWLFISNKYEHKLNIQVPITQRIVLFSQIKGKSNVKLISHDCINICNEKHIHLNKGQICKFILTFILIKIENLF